MIPKHFILKQEQALRHLKWFIVKEAEEKDIKFSRRIPLLSISAPMVSLSLMSYPSLSNAHSYYSHFNSLPTVLIKIAESFLLNNQIKK